MLLFTQIVDAFYFLYYIYRSDVKEYGHRNETEIIINEEQFEVLESFCKDEFKKVNVTNLSDFVGVKDLVLSFRERLGIQKEIHNLLFDEMKHNEAMYKVKFYNQVKKIITRSSGLDKNINIRIFTSLI